MCVYVSVCVEEKDSCILGRIKRNANFTLCYITTHTQTLTPHILYTVTVYTRICMYRTLLFTPKFVRSLMEIYSRFRMFGVTFVAQYVEGVARCAFIVEITLYSI